MSRWDRQTRLGLGGVWKKREREEKGGKGKRSTSAKRKWAACWVACLLAGLGEGTPFFFFPSGGSKLSVCTRWGTDGGGHLCRMRQTQKKKKRVASWQWVRAKGARPGPRKRKELGCFGDGGLLLLSALTFFLLFFFGGGADGACAAGWLVQPMRRVGLSCVGREEDPKQYF